MMASARVRECSSDFSPERDSSRETTRSLSRDSMQSLSRDRTRSDSRDTTGSASHDQTRESSPSSESEYEEKEYELEDFQIIKTIGTGTFGRVVLARDTLADEFVAMKILAMADVLRLKQRDHVLSERDILAQLNHPFIVNLRWWAHDLACLYMVFDYVAGGELFSHLRRQGRFNNDTGMFYAAEIVSALEYIHVRGVAYRDLKPENLLLAADGHLKLTDFGFAKRVIDRTWTLCGTPEYLAPEIIQSKGHNKAVDWWALGVLIYEMLVGYPPFYDDNPFGIYERILSGRVDYPRHLQPAARDLCKRLLVHDRTKRLGNMKGGTEDVKRHRWFKSVDWADVFLKKLQPPLVPAVRGAGDTSNFDDYPESEWKAARELTPDELRQFDAF